jgi:hypothetical protein
MTQECEFADELEQNYPIELRDLNDSVAFVPQEFCADTLLSEWPATQTQILHRPAPAIPTELQAKIRQIDFIGHVPNTVGWKATQVPYSKDTVQLRTPTRLKGGKKVTPGFVRERKSRGEGGGPSKSLNFKGLTEDASPMKRKSDLARCAFSDRILHSRMPLDPTHVRSKRTCV